MTNELQDQPLGAVNHILNGTCNYTLHVDNNILSYTACV